MATFPCCAKLELILLFTSICRLFVFGCPSTHNLESVVAVFRHGDRTPLMFYPKDPYQNLSLWPEGLGQLTNKGKQRIFQLGKWFRQRYGNFIPEKYSRDDIIMRSTDSDRTLMSAQTLLAGLYPPKGEQIWENSLLWQPIPVHIETERIDLDIVLSQSCKRFTYLHEILLNQINEGNPELKKLYQYLSNNTGTDVNTLLSLSFVYDTLKCESERNLRLPGWAAKVFPDKIEPWVAFILASYTYNNDLTKLTTGIFFDSLIKYFNEIINHNSTIHKFQMFSGHDLNIVNFLNSLNLVKYPVPEYGSTILFELHNFKGNHYVDILYKNRDVLQTMILPNCEIHCPFLKFKEILEALALTMDEWLTACQLTS